MCKGWRRGVDTLVTRLQVGPHNRDQQPWNRQLLMLEKLPVLFPCLREIDFDQVTICTPLFIIHTQPRLTLRLCIARSKPRFTIS